MVVFFYGGGARCTGGGSTPIVWMKGRNLISMPVPPAVVLWMGSYLRAMSV
jgi:hypothetical protein